MDAKQIDLLIYYFRILLFDLKAKKDEILT